jgi:hypothetical protein
MIDGPPEMQDLDCVVSSGVLLLEAVIPLKRKSCDVTEQEHAVILT